LRHPLIGIAQEWRKVLLCHFPGSSGLTSTRLGHGVEALRPLVDRLPPPIRSAAIEMMLSFDAASVVATTRFLASNSQPIESVRQLASIDAPVTIVPGSDPEHPSEVATLYAENIRDSSTVDLSSPDLLEQISRFSDGLA
jgi:hypothetical protein